MKGLYCSFSWKCHEGFEKNFTGLGVHAQEEFPSAHAVWSGRCGDGTLLISCSRSGDKCTKLYRPVDTEVFGLEQMNADEGVGASNICVKETENSVVLYAANHEQGEVARYTIM